MAGGLPDRARWVLALALTTLAVVAAGVLTTAGASAPAASGTNGQAAAAASQHPNIVFVLTDDLSWNLLKYMPHVQQMRKEGETFTHYFVTDSLCCPSRASIFSGRVPHNTGVFTNTPPDGGFSVFHDRGEESDTFATDISSTPGAHYRTAMMGKYLNGYQASSLYVPPGWSEWDVAANGYPEFNYRLNENGKLVSYGDAPGDYLTDVLANKGVGFINRSANAGDPFMLEIATFAPHSPFTPAPRDAQDFPGLQVPRTPAFNAQNSNPPNWLAGRPPLTNAQIATLDHNFRKRAQSVEAVDGMIGQIRATLATRGLSQDTYIVFSSDNGFHMGDHRLLAGKTTAFDTDIGVPLIVVGPGVPAGRSVGRLAANIDLRPTFGQLAGASVPSTVDGRSLVPLLNGSGVSSWRTATLVEHHGGDQKRNDPDAQPAASGNPSTYEAMRTNNAVYVEYLNGDREYYDLTKDPYELNNVYGDLSGPQRAGLHKTLDKLERCSGQSCWVTGG
jgi:N-acetylglucosamine-6-sulfatase